MGEAEQGEAAPRQAVTLLCANEHRSVVTFSTEAQVPDMWDRPARSPGEPGLREPPRRRRSSPTRRTWPTWKERRSDKEAADILDEAPRALLAPQVRRHHLLSRVGASCPAERRESARLAVPTGRPRVGACRLARSGRRAGTPRREFSQGRGRERLSLTRAAWAARMMRSHLRARRTPPRTRGLMLVQPLSEIARRRSAITRRWSGTGATRRRRTRTLKQVLVAEVEPSEEVPVRQTSTWARRGRSPRGSEDAAPIHPVTRCARPPRADRTQGRHPAHPGDRSMPARNLTAECLQAKHRVEPGDGLSVHRTRPEVPRRANGVVTAMPSTSITSLVDKVRLPLRRDVVAQPSVTGRAEEAQRSQLEMRWGARTIGAPWSQLRVAIHHDTVRGRRVAGVRHAARPSRPGAG